MRIYLSLSCLLLTTTILFTQNFSGGFNFYLPPDDSTAQRFLPEFPAEPITAFVGISPEGHFEVEGVPTRFWGVNLTTGACFPVKEKAAFIAARMRKMGINLVRFHHMDNPWSGNEGTIFDRNLNTTRQLDPLTLDRLHYFLAQLKRNNIYVNMNLHVSRTFLEGDGVAQADSITDFGKGVTYFDGHLVNLQKEFAAQLLGSVNPYTGLAMVDDPVLGMVEITNENTLYGWWKDNRLRAFSEAGTLIARHVDTLDRKWHEFLEAKYGFTEFIEAAWEEESSPVTSINQILDGSFESGNINTAWQLELHETAMGAISADQSTVFSGNYSGRVQVDAVTGTDWHIQFKQAGLSFEAGKTYVLQFTARADQNRTINMGVMRDNAPYTYYGGAGFNLTTDWQNYIYTFTAPEDNLGNGRITVNFNNQTGTVWFDDFTFGEPNLNGLEPGETLANQSIRRVPYSERLIYSPQRIADLAEFYIGIQRDYYDEMYRYLKEDLDVKVPITGTNALVGPADVLSMESLDYIDDHAYWNHPWFPNEPWSTTDWLMSNLPMIQEADLGTMSGIFSGLAVEGKPYTISEYNHPFPNRYQTEMMPLLMGYASFHDADGLMFFEYNGGSPSDWEADFVPGFFSMHRNHALMGLSPVFGYAYRNYLLEAASSEVVSLSPEYVYKEIPQFDNGGRWDKLIPYDRTIGLSNTIRSNYENTEEPNFDDLPATEQTVFNSSTQEMLVDVAEGTMVLNAPNFISMAGFLQNMDGTSAGPIELVEANDFGVFAWMSLSDTLLTDAFSSVMVLSSKIQNAGMIWDGIETVRDDWGMAPTSIFPLNITLKIDVDASHLKIYPLNRVGKESSYFNVLPNNDGTFTLNLNQSTHKTLWFGVEVSQGPVNAQEELLPTRALSLFPNPAKDILQVEYQLNTSSAVALEMIDMTGRLVRKKQMANQAIGIHQERFNLEELPAGIYTLKLRVGTGVRTEKFVKQ